MTGTSVRHRLRERIGQARRTMQEVIDADERILTDKPTQIAVAQLADSSVNFRCSSRLWRRVLRHAGTGEKGLPPERCSHPFHADGPSRARCH